MFPRRITLAVCLVFHSCGAAVQACGFNENTANLRTLRDEAAGSKIIMFGTLANARKGPDQGSTDLVITRTIKTDPVLKGRKTVRIPRYIPIQDPKNPPSYLVFADVVDGKPDIYKGIPGKRSLVEYVEGAMAIDGKDRVKLMRYCFGYLEHENRAIAWDAFGEFIKSTDPDIRRASRLLSADKLRRWLQDEHTERIRARLYGFLLAGCGTREDADLLRKVIEQRMKQDGMPQIDGILSGYTLLSPKEGWAYTCELLKDPKRPFPVRFGALRAVRYLHNSKSNVVTEKEILSAIGHALGQTDMADIPIDYLRLWKSWQLTGQVLALFDKKGFDIPIIRRSIVRYALQCTEGQAVRFIADLRKADPTLVEEVEESLKPDAKPTSTIPVHLKPRTRAVRRTAPAWPGTLADPALPC
jgi:hypothetical protein